jgi:DNA-binding CsgD family transcriptional regulator
VDWADYCQIVERMEAQLGGGDAYDKFVEAEFYKSAPEITELAAVLISPKLLHRVTAELLDPLLFPAFEFLYEDAGVDRIRLGCWIKPGARPCLAFMRGSVAAIRSHTRHLGLPPAEVVADITPTHYVADVRLPSSRTLGARLQRGLRRATRIILGYDPQGLAIATTFGDDVAPGQAPSLAELKRTYQLTPKQADVLAGILDGLSNKEIAHSLGSSESTVEKHVTIIFGKLGVTTRVEALARLLKV